MRIIYTLLAIALCPIMQAQVVSSEFMEHYTIDDVEEVLEEFGLPVNFLPINYEVDFYKIIYMTEHPNGEMVEVSGALLVPSDVDCPLPLSSYQHGTIAAKSDAPSQGGDELLLGVLYASVGIACTLPDYIGLGESDGFHLYIHADSEASTSMNLVIAAHDLQEELNYNLNGQHVIWGYSQGGHATLALQKLWEEEYVEEYNLIASAPMSGPYDVSGVQAEVITSDNYYPTPGYLPYVVLSYQEVYGNLYDDLGDLFIEPYAGLIQDLFDGVNGMGYINSQLPDIPNEMLLPDQLEDFQNNPENPMRIALEDNDLYDWTPQVQTRLYYCEGDDQVNYMNSVIAEEFFAENGSTSVTALDGGDYDHSDCAPLAMLGGFNFFQDVIEPSFNPQIDIEVTDASAIGAEDGAISVTADDITGWSFDWSNGSTGAELDGLSVGFLVLTITNDQGCTAEFDVSVGVMTGLELAESIAFSVFPNPTSESTKITFSSSMLCLQIVAPTGQIVAQQQMSSGEELPLSNLEVGVYSLMTTDGRFLSRIVKF